MSKMRWYERHIFVALGMTSMCFALTYLLFGFYYVDYEGLFDAMYSGSLTPGVRFGSIYFLAHIGLSQAYSYLYSWWPQVEWLSWILYSYLFIAVSLGMYLISALFPERFSTRTKLVVMFIVYWLIFADHSIHFIFTRVSYMLSGLSLISLIVLFRSPAAIRQRWGLFILLEVLLVIGILTRLESGTATVSLMIFFGWFYLQNWRQWLRIFVCPLLLIASLLAGISHEIRTGREFHLQIEPDIELQYGERQNMIAISAMHTHRDSVMYQAAHSMMWSDPAVLSPSYLRSLVQKEGFIFTDSRQWGRTYDDITALLSRYKVLLIIWALLAIAVYTVYRGHSRSSRYYLLAFELSFFALNIVQTYTAKINDRSFAPFLSLFLLCHVILLLALMHERTARRISVILTICGVLWMVNLCSLKIEANTLQADLDIYRANLAKIKTIAAGKILAVNSNSLDYLCLANRPFHAFDFLSFRRVYVTDGSMIPFLPYYKRYLERECACDIYRFPDFWRYLCGERADVVVLSEPLHIRIVTDYVQEIHNFNLPLREVKTVDLAPERKSESRDNPEQAHIYVLRHDPSDISK